MSPCPESEGLQKMREDRNANCCHVSTLTRPAAPPANHIYRKLPLPLHSDLLGRREPGVRGSPGRGVARELAEPLRPQRSSLGLGEVAPGRGARVKEALQ